MDEKKISIVGLGAIGSYMSIALSKAGIGHGGYDFDTVTGKNIQNQAYSMDQRGDMKAYALVDMSSKLTGHPHRWRKSDVQGREMIIACADDMQTRRDIAEAADVMFDTRLAGNQITLYAETEPGKLLASMDYENEDVPDEVDTCHTPSSTHEVVLTAVGVMLKNIKHYLDTGELLWTYCGIDLEYGTMMYMGRGHGY